MVFQKKKSRCIIPPIPLATFSLRTFRLAVAKKQFILGSLQWHELFLDSNIYEYLKVIWNIALQMLLFGPPFALRATASISTLNCLSSVLIVSARTGVLQL